MRISASRSIVMVSLAVTLASSGSRAAPQVARGKAGPGPAATGPDILAPAGAIPPAADHPMLVPQEAVPASVMAVSADGDVVAFEGFDRAVRVWSVRSGWIRFSLPAYSLQGAAWWKLSPDGDTLAVASGTVMSLWNTVTGERVGAIDLPSQTNDKGVVFSTHSSKVAVQLADLTLFDATDGRAAVRMHAGVPPSGPVAFSPDGQTVLAAYPDGIVRLWKVADGQLAGAIACPGTPITSGQFSPDGKLVAVVCNTQTPGGAVRPDSESTATVYEVATHLARFSFDWSPGISQSLQFSPDGRLLAAPNSGPADERSEHARAAIQIRSTTTGKIQCQATVLGWLTDMAWSHDSASLSLLADNYWQTIDAQTGKVLDQMSSLPAMRAARLVRDGKGVIGAAQTGALVTADLASGTCREMLRPCVPVGELKSSPDDKLLATPILMHGTTFIWDQQTASPVATLETGFPVAFSGNSSTIASINADGTISLHHLHGAVAAALIIDPHTQPLSMTFSHDDKLLAIVTGKDVKLYDTWAGTLKQTISPSWHVKGLAFSSDDRSLALALTSMGATIYQLPEKLELWDVATAALKTTIPTHDNWGGMDGNPLGVVFTPDGQKVVFYSDFRPISVYDVKTALPVSMGQGVSYQASGVVFSPDGKYMAIEDQGNIPVFETATFKVVLTAFGRSPIFSADSRYMFARGFGPSAPQAWDMVGLKRIDDLHAITGPQDMPNTLDWQRPGNTSMAVVRGDKTVAKLIFMNGIPDPAWLLTTPDGYFNCSDNAAPLLKWNVGGKLYPFEAYSAKFRSPDMVKKAFEDAAAATATTPAVAVGPGGAG